MHDFETLFIGPLGNIGSLSQADLPNVVTFYNYLQYQKIMFLNITMNIMRKTFNIGNIINSL